MVLDGLFRKGLAVWLAAFTPQPPQILGDMNAGDFLDGYTRKLGEDDFQNIGIPCDGGWAVGAVPYTQRHPHFIHKLLKGERAGNTRHRFSFFQFFEVSLLRFILPQDRHLLDFLACLGIGQFFGRIPGGTPKDLLAVGITPNTGFDFEGYNFLSLDFFLDRCHRNYLPAAFGSVIEQILLIQLLT